MPKILFFTILGIISAGILRAAEETPLLVADKSSDRYHVSTCKIVPKIRPQDVVLFPKPEDAFNEAGLKPCRKCHPPVPASYKPEASNFGPKHGGEKE